MEEPRVKSTKFQSPVPFLIRLRNFVFGKNKPDVFTLLTFYINLICCIVFLAWNITGYIAITSREMILEFKGINVEEIIHNRGIALRFEPVDFIGRLTTFYAIGVICWGVVFFGLILLYRKRKTFAYFIFGGTLFYFGMHIFYLSFQYFREDTTSTDKILLLIVITSTLLHTLLMRNERNGGSISFFGEVEDDE